jgi:hypothetical protein
MGSNGSVRESSPPLGEAVPRGRSVGARS